MSCYYLITLMFAVMAGKYDDDYYDCAVLLCAAFESKKGSERATRNDFGELSTSAVKHFGHELS